MVVLRIGCGSEGKVMVNDRKARNKRAGEGCGYNGQGKEG